MASTSVTAKELFKAGAHFGHRTSYWHPKMAPYIHGQKGSVHIIDLIQTEQLLATATAAIEEIASQGKQVLFVGTKRQAKAIIKNHAERAGMPYVTERWLGGMLTNHQTMNARVAKMKKLESQMESGELADKYNKLEVQQLQEEIDSLRTIFGGISELSGVPGAIVIADVAEDHVAVAEAARLKVPIFAICDTNIDPTPVTYPILANDDAINTIDLVVSTLATAVEQGAKTASAKTEAPEADKKEEK